MSLFETLRFFPILQRCLPHVFAEDSNKIGRGVKVQLSGNITDGERGIAQQAAGLGEYLVEDVSFCRLSQRLAHNFVQIVGSDAETVGVVLVPCSSWKWSLTSCTKSST